MSDLLAARLRDEIRLGGPITFARFMAVALTDPEHGYYTRGAPRPAREGDFLTAPEMDPVFGLVLARQVDECWRLLGSPDPFTLREHGAGSGALVTAIVEGLRENGSTLVAAGATGRAPLRYEPVEIDLVRLRELVTRLGALAPEVEVAAPPALPSGAVPPSGAAPSVAGAPAAGDRMTGLILANELVDALPVHRVVGRPGSVPGIDEILVGWADDPAAPLGGRFTDVVAVPTTPALAARLADEGIVLADGQPAEVRLVDVDWVAGVARDLERGYVLVIDYGAPASELYDPVRRPAGTLLAYAGHRALDDVYADPGDRDITAHVDATALERAAAASGLEVLGRTAQAGFLLACGLEEVFGRLRADPSLTPERYLTLRSAVRRLLDPRLLGGFFVLALGRALPPEARRIRGIAGAEDRRPDPGDR
jgi:SAM-dependent MidA family methyltransferase